MHDSSGNIDHNMAEQHTLRVYDIYKQYLAKQKKMQIHNYNAQLISDVLKGLTSLKSVKISLGRFLDTAPSKIGVLRSTPLSQPETRLGVTKHERGH